MPSVDIVLSDAFPILSLTLITEPLRVANRESADHAWRCRCLSVSGGPVLSSSGIPVDTAALDDRRQDIVILLSSYHPETSMVAQLLDWLRRKARDGAVMGCVDTGALIFAKAGLLTKTPAAVHFEALPGYREQFMEATFVDRLYAVSHDRCSSAGGVATIDMTLGLIERFSGRDIMARVSEVLTYRPTEYGGPQQRLLTDTSLRRTDENLGKAVEVMISNLDQPLPITEVAKRIGIPQWTLSRLFKRHFKQTPADYYRTLRLKEGRNLLRNSSLRVGVISTLCGFENPESFARAYRRLFGVSATQDRAISSGIG